MSRQNKIISSAMEQALLSNMPFKHGAILSKGPKIIVKGYNRNRSKFLNVSYTSIHAEMDVIRQYCDNILHINVDLRCNTIKIPKINRYILWVVRIDKHHKLMYSKPCSNCLGLLKKMGVKKIGYSDKNGNIVIENTQNIFTDYLSSAQKKYNLLIN